MFNVLRKTVNIDLANEFKLLQPSEVVQVKNFTSADIYVALSAEDLDVTVESQQRTLLIPAGYSQQICENMSGCCLIDKLYIKASANGVVEVQGIYY